MTNIFSSIEGILTHSNLVVQLMLGEASRFATALEIPEIVPIQPSHVRFVDIEARTRAISARFYSDRYEYHFYRGHLVFITPRAIPATEMPPSFLTNSVVNLSQRECQAMAEGRLAALGYDIAALKRHCRLGFQQELLYLKRDDRPFFPWLSANPIAMDMQWRSKLDSVSGLAITMLNSSGQSWRWNGSGFDVLSRLGVGQPKPMEVDGASDFKPVTLAHVYTSVRPASMSDTISSLEIERVVISACHQLEGVLGGRKPGLVLLVDNLNSPDKVAALLQRHLGEIPWSGFSWNWDSKISETFASTNHVTVGIRGIELMAFTDITGVQISRSGAFPAESTLEGDGKPHQPFKDSQESEYRQAIQACFAELNPSGSLANPAESFAIALVPLSGQQQSHFRSLLPDKTLFMGSQSSPSSVGTLYLDGKVLRTSEALLARVHGDMPVRKQMKSFESKEAAVWELDSEITYPLRKFGQHIQPNPMEFVVSTFGPQLLSFLQRIDRVEAFRLAPKNLATEGLPGHELIGAYTIVGRTNLYLPWTVRRLTDAITDPANLAGSETEDLCAFNPEIAFRFEAGENHATLLVSLNCQRGKIESGNIGGSSLSPRDIPLKGSISALAQVAQSAFPAESIFAAPDPNSK